MNSLELLDRLVAFPTVSADTNLPLVDFVRSYLDERGIECRTIADAAGVKANLFATIGPASADGVVLSGHTDVVPVAGQRWATDPFALSRRGDRLFGRGAADMKGFLACAMRAADIASRSPLKRPLHLAFSYDEEIGCVGVRPMLEELASRGFAAAACIVGEPTSMQIALGHKGKAAARATCLGEAGHSSMAPDYLNAIHLACDLVSRIRACQEEIALGGARDESYGIPYTTLHVGKIAGGTALNVVAEHASVDFEIRHLAEDDPSRICDRLRSEAAAIVGSLGTAFSSAAIRIDALNNYPGLDTPRDSPAVGLCSSLLDAPRYSKVSFGTEAGLYSSLLGIPTVVVGPGSMEQGHKADEFICVDEIGRCDAMMDRLVERLCEG